MIFSNVIVIFIVMLMLTFSKDVFLLYIYVICVYICVLCVYTYIYIEGKYSLYKYICINKLYINYMYIKLYNIYKLKVYIYVIYLSIYRFSFPGLWRELFIHIVKCSLTHTHNCSQDPSVSFTLTISLVNRT